MEDINNLDLEELTPAAGERHNLAKELFGDGFPDLGLKLMFVLETFGVGLPDFMLSKLMFVLDTFGVGLADLGILLREILGVIFEVSKSGVNRLLKLVFLLQCLIIGVPMTSGKASKSSSVHFRYLQ